jgi:hypothetical protein
MIETKKERKQFENGAWNFKLDKVNLYAYWNDAFTKEECEKIIKIAKSKGLVKGVTRGESDTRKSKVSWLYPCNDTEWVFRRLTDIILNLNERFFGFDIFGLNEGLQFTNYTAPGDKYGKHIDRAMDFIVRKLSISIQLTDPKNIKVENFIFMRMIKVH